MGLFRVLIYGIILGVYAGSLVYDVRFLPRIGFHWWAAKLVMLSVINLVCFYLFFYILKFSTYFLINF